MRRRYALSYFVLFVANSLSFAEDAEMDRDPYNMQMKAILDAKYSASNFNRAKAFNCEGPKLQLKFLKMHLPRSFHPLYNPAQKRKITLDAGQRTIQEDNNTESLNDFIRKKIKSHGIHGEDSQNILQKIFHRIRSYPRVGRAGSQMDDFHLRASFIPRLGRKRSPQS